MLLTNQASISMISDNVMHKPKLPSPYRGLLQHAVLGPWLLTCLIAACGAGAAATEQSLQGEPAGQAAQVAELAGQAAAAPVMTPRRIDLDLSRARTTLTGEIFVVKLHDGAGHTYYLGTAGTASHLDLRLLLPQGLDSLRLEVFTEQSEAGSFQDDIAL